MDIFSELLTQAEIQQEGYSVVDSKKLQKAHFPPFPPDMPLFVTGIADQAELDTCFWVLKTEYRPMPLTFWAEGKISDRLNKLETPDIIKSNLTFPGTLLVAPLGENTAMENFLEITARLRAPDGCPWDKEQTHLSLRKHLLEETYEALDALDKSDLAGLKEELGDLLLQITLHAQIAAEAGEFTFADIVQGISTKIIRRHPHVFGDVELSNADAVLRNWENLKAKERKDNGEEKVKGLLDGVSVVLPALAQAYEIQDRAARVGFDWSDIKPVKEKVLEELKEVELAQDQEAIGHEVGDLLFAVVNLARWLKVDAEAELRHSNQKFRNRFKYIEKNADIQGRKLNEMTLAEMDIWWEEAKKGE